jgi:polyribonucleotide nucleotidyltransferase
MKPHAPRIEQIRIPKDMIGAIIGPGGKIIQDIQAKSNATIVVEEIDNFGYVDVFADNKESIDTAMRMIKGILSPFLKLAPFIRGRSNPLLHLVHLLRYCPGKKVSSYIGN